jgi:hypothetical protein
MKNFLYLSLIFVLFLSCKKDKTGTIVYQVKFDCSKQGKSHRSFHATNTDSVYTQFGDYIGSITPIQYTTNFNFLFAQSSNYVVNYVGNNWEGSTVDPFINIDFSGNQEVTVTPAIMKTDVDQNGQTNWIACESYDDNEPTFDYFSFVARYFYQKFQLPVEYNGVVLDQLNSLYYFNNDVPERTDNEIKAWSTCLFQPLNTVGRFLRFNFGVYNPAVTPFMQNDTSVAINGSFTPITLTMPAAGETKILYSTLSFDTENLIQIYAGSDNIPYTSDDKIVYAPDYWDRMQVKMEIR